MVSSVDTRAVMLSTRSKMPSTLSRNSRRSAISRRKRSTAASVSRAVELGITLVDTADAYGPEVNERFIAETLYPYPKGLIIATKGGLRRPRREAWENNGRPEHLRAACEGSLRRLKLERIDIYQLHAPDPQVPLDESVGALAELQSEGKIRHIGLSNVSVNELCRAQRIAPIVSGKTVTISPTARLRMCLLSVRKADLPSCLRTPWLLAAMRRGGVRSRACLAAR